MDKQRKKFLDDLRAAGWKRPYSTADHYRHPDGGAFYHDTMTEGHTWWWRMAHSGLMPDTRMVYRHGVNWGEKVVKDAG